MLTAIGFIVMWVAASSMCTANAVESPPRPCGPTPSRFTATARACTSSAAPSGIGCRRVPSSSRRRTLREQRRARSEVPPTPDADDRRRAGLAAGREHAVDHEGLDRVDAFGRESPSSGTSCSPSRCPSGSSRSASVSGVSLKSRCGSPAPRCRRSCARSCASAGARPSCAAGTRASRVRSRGELACFSAWPSTSHVAADPHVVDRHAGVLAQQVVRVCSATAMLVTIVPSTCFAVAAGLCCLVSRAQAGLMSGGRFLERADVELFRGVFHHCGEVDSSSG